MGRTPESDLATKIVKALEREYPTGTFWKNPAGRGLTVGTPDISGVLYGWAVAIEVKTSRGKASRIQVYRLGRLRASGAVAGEARSPLEAVTLLQGLKPRGGAFTAVTEAGTKKGAPPKGHP